MFFSGRVNGHTGEFIIVFWLCHEGPFGLFNRIKEQLSKFTEWQGFGLKSIR